jgi:two-component system, sensor histidine kinase and response regulator
MDGYETTRQIRKMKRQTSLTPIIAMTANAIEGDRERCLDAGMNDYISKPIDKDILVEKLKSWIAALAKGPQGQAAEVKGAENEDDPEALPVFDCDEAAARYDHDLDLLKAIIEGFIQESPTAMDAIASAIGSADSATVGLKAHALKGGASYIGAKRIQHAAFSLEKCGKSGDLSTAAELASALRQEFERFRDLTSAFNWADQRTPAASGEHA